MNSVLHIRCSLTITYIHHQKNRPKLLTVQSVYFSILTKFGNNPTAKSFTSDFWDILVNLPILTCWIKKTRQACTSCWGTVMKDTKEQRSVRVKGLPMLPFTFCFSVLILWGGRPQLSPVWEKNFMVFLLWRWDLTHLTSVSKLFI